MHTAIKIFFQNIINDCKIFLFAQGIFESGVNSLNNKLKNI